MIDGISPAVPDEVAALADLLFEFGTGWQITPLGSGEEYWLTAVRRPLRAGEEPLRARTAAQMRAALTEAENAGGGLP
jgi:hypothetical protein